MRRESDDKFLVMAAGAGRWRLEFVDLVDRERTKWEIRERERGSQINSFTGTRSMTGFYIRIDTFGIFSLTTKKLKKILSIKNNIVTPTQKIIQMFKTRIIVEPTS